MMGNMFKKNKPHKNYFELEADCHYDLGRMEGELFAYHIKEYLDYERRNSSWKKKIKQSVPYLSATKKYFPDIFDELRGQADAVSVPIQELFALVIEDELGSEVVGKCTSVLTKDGRYFAHNEDWAPEAKDSICVLKRKVSGVTILELFYISSLGGNSISINSHGVIQSINSLSHKDYQIGVPKSIISRHLCGVSDPQSEIKKIAKIPRSSGFHHLFYSIKDNRALSWECSAKKDFSANPKLPFIHTNHYLGQLSSIEYNNNIDYSRERFSIASKELNGRSLASMGSTQQKDIKSIMSSRSSGIEKSLYNQRTIAQVVIDFEERSMNISLEREKSRGWVRYPLNFLNL